MDNGSGYLAITNLQSSPARKRTGEWGLASLFPRYEIRRCSDFWVTRKDLPATDKLSVSLSAIDHIYHGSSASKPITSLHLPRLASSFQIPFNICPWITPSQLFALRLGLLQCHILLPSQLRACLFASYYYVLHTAACSRASTSFSVAPALRATYAFDYVQKGI